MKKLFLVFVFAVFAFVGCGSQVETAAVVNLTPISVLPHDNSITVRGTVESVESRNIYSVLGLTVAHVYVTEGDVVEPGQVLAVLDTGDLELTIAQQRATLDVTRRAAQNAVAETQRLLDELTANISNNMHIVNAEAALNAAAIGVEIARQNHDFAVADYVENSNPQVLAAESLLRTIRTELESMETTFDNNLRLFEAGIVTNEEMRLTENALEQIRNQYNDANTGYLNAVAFQRRAIEQLETALAAAETSHSDAQNLLISSRIAVNQEITMMRGNLASAEIAANLEPMEIAIQLLERQLKDSVITSPISGTVTSVIAREGAVAMGALFVVEDTENLRVMTSFREYDIARVDTGMEVSIISDAIGNMEYAGVINRINPAASPFSPVVEFEAEVLVMSPNTGLRIGMNTRLEINLE